ncbi:hypothetical protein KM043_004158 [Ampulex compressa]|nr:hypothetical protein KM043_004158 [Ampulex compressa]
MGGQHFYLVLYAEFQSELSSYIREIIVCRKAVNRWAKGKIRYQKVSVTLGEYKSGASIISTGRVEARTAWPIVLWNRRLSNYENSASDRYDRRTERPTIPG